MKCNYLSKDIQKRRFYRDDLMRSWFGKRERSIDQEDWEKNNSEKERERETEKGRVLIPTGNLCTPLYIYTHNQTRKGEN